MDLIILSILALASVIFCILTLATKLIVPQKEYADLIIHEGPKPVPASKTVTIQADGHPLFVCDTAVNDTYDYIYYRDNRPPLPTVPVTSFEFANGTVTLEIAVTGVDSLTDVVVRPLAKRIKPAVRGNVITFSVSEPGAYTVEYNGNADNAVHIFANAIDPNAPTESRGNVKYIGPGAWLIDKIILEDNMELYISGGAIVRGTINARGVSNVKVHGNGYLNGTHYESWIFGKREQHVPVNIADCHHMCFSGIGLLDSNAWCFNIYDCSDVKLDNIKIISARPNGDGITIQSSQDIHVTNGFVRTWDDSLVIKNYSKQEGHDCENISFDGVQIWTDLAQSMEIGYETNKGRKESATIRDITFRNITVLHNFHKPVMSIHNADLCAVSGIRYRNIIVEDASMGRGDGNLNAQLIDITTCSNGNWSSTQLRGCVDDVVFEDIYVLDGDDMADRIPGNLCPIRISGTDETSMCKNVTVNNLFVLGKPITDGNVLDNPTSVIDEYTDNIHFVNNSPIPAEIAALSATK